MLGELHQNNEKKLPQGLQSFFCINFWADFAYQVLLGWLCNVQIPLPQNYLNAGFLWKNLLGEACPRCCVDTIPAHRDSLKTELLDLQFWAI